MTVSRPKMTEKLDRLIDDVRLLRAQIIGLDRQLKGKRPSDPTVLTA
jgi:hypothetical protein